MTNWPIKPGRSLNLDWMCDLDGTQGNLFFFCFTWLVSECHVSSLLVPAVGNQRIDADQVNIGIAWDEVTAAAEVGIVSGVSCISPGNGPGEVSATGGIFGVGTHTIICTAFDLDGCLATGYFTFNVEGKHTHTHKRYTRRTYRHNG